MVHVGQLAAKLRNTGSSLVQGCRMFTQAHRHTHQMKAANCPLTTLLAIALSVSSPCTFSSVATMP